MKKAIGNKGEALAAQYLLQHGYTILQQNWRYKHLEVDIIASPATLPNNGILVIVEVKTANTLLFGEPQEWVTPSKQKHLLAAANAYVALSHFTGEVRFDVIGILLSNPIQIKHLVDAFSASS